MVYSFLEPIIFNSGVWSYWSIDNWPNTIQLEFSNVQLLIPDKNSPLGFNTQIALQFLHPKEILFYTHKNHTLDKNWLMAYNESEFPFFLKEKGLFINTLDALSKDYQLYATLLGETNDFKSRCLMLCHEIACEIQYTTFEVYTNQMHQPSANELELYHEDWVLYHKLYWFFKHQNKPLPYNYSCETYIIDYEQELVELTEKAIKNDFFERYTHLKILTH